MSKLLTKEFLLRNGFDVVKHVADIPNDFIDIDYTPAFDVLLVEKKFDRQAFAVRFHGENDISFFIMIDVGCGCVEIPNGFRQTTEEDFCKLYEGIRREKLPVAPSVDIEENENPYLGRTIEETEYIEKTGYIPD